MSPNTRQPCSRAQHYVVPPSGVLRTSHVDVLGNYAINPRLVCREPDGTIVRGWIDGPYHGGHLYVVKLVPWSAGRKPLFSLDQLNEWSEHGIPPDYVVPHEDR